MMTARANAWTLAERGMRTNKCVRPRHEKKPGFDERTIESSLTSCFYWGRARVVTFPLAGPYLYE